MAASFKANGNADYASQESNRPTGSTPTVGAYAVGAQAAGAQVMEIELSTTPSVPQEEISVAKAMASEPEADAATTSQPEPIEIADW
ncbi:MAG: hypothetical protein AAFU71_07450, partial [Cyanobacteria bacterium J06632_22]